MIFTHSNAHSFTSSNPLVLTPTRNQRCRCAALHVCSFVQFVFVGKELGRPITACGLPCRASRLMITSTTTLPPPPPPPLYIHSEKRWNETSRASGLSSSVMRSLFFSHVPPTSCSSLFTPLVQFRFFFSSPPLVGQSFSQSPLRITKDDSTSSSSSSKNNNRYH